MGNNVSGKRDDEEEGRESMEFAQSGHDHQLPHSIFQSPHHHTPMASHPPLLFTPQAPLQRADEIMQNKSTCDDSKVKTGEYGGIVPSSCGVPTMITWSHGGHEVAVQGSWDDWKTIEYLERREEGGFTIMKVLPVGVYRFRFIVDGRWRCAREFPRECDDLGNVFNVLDLQNKVPAVPNTPSWPESPPSPPSTYNSAPLSAEDFNVKVPDLPPLLQQSLLDQPSSSSRGSDNEDSLEEPSPAVLNHLYVQRARHVQSTVALNSTHRFRAKYVTVVLYKSLHKLIKK